MAEMVEQLVLGVVSMRRRVNSGFTLIELLVVIAIIAILAAILFPIFISARESARVTRCAANLANIGRALAMYRDDYDGRNCHIWQNGVRSPGGADDQGSFFWVITRYVGQKMDWSTPTGNENKDRNTVYKCPSAPWLKQQTQGTVTVDGKTYQIGIGARLNVGFAYTMNETNWNHGKFAAGGLKDCEFKRPSQIIFVGEGMGWVSYGIGYGDGKVINNNQISGPTTSGDGWNSINPAPDEVIPMVDRGPNGETGIGPRHGSWCKIYNLRVSHNGGTMFMFYDGHTKLLKVTKGLNWRVDI
jgi:prepilin-type N-terminal cleavage/methylation domain-containing protein/prepilin-type processing-associated H-X9-DG protein